MNVTGVQTCALPISAGLQALCLKPCGWKLEDLVNVSDGASLVAHTVKSLPAMQETRVPSPGQEGLLEKDMATRSRARP